MGNCTNQDMNNTSAEVKNDDNSLDTPNNETSATRFQPKTKGELRTAVRAYIGGDITTYGEINTWDVSDITDMSYMFYDATAFNQVLYWKDKIKSNVVTYNIFKNSQGRLATLEEEDFKIKQPTLEFLAMTDKLDYLKWGLRVHGDVKELTEEEYYDAIENDPYKDILAIKALDSEKIQDAILRHLSVIQPKRSDK